MIVNGVVGLKGTVGSNKGVIKSDNSGVHPEAVPISTKVNLKPVQ